MKSLVTAFLIAAGMAMASGALAQTPSDASPARGADAAPSKSDAPKKSKDAKKQTKPSKSAKKSKPTTKKTRKAGKSAR